MKKITSYADLLEQNETAEGIEWEELSTKQLFQLEDQIESWDHPLALDILYELERRAGITDPKGLLDYLNADPGDVYVWIGESLLPDAYDWTPEDK